MDLTSIKGYPDLSDIEKRFCKIDENILPYCHYFTSGIIEDIPQWIFNSKELVPLRELALFRMGFSVVTKNNCRELNKIIAGERVLEVMCGLGSYSATLRNLGVDVIATDDMSWAKNDDSKYGCWQSHFWTDDIIQIDAVNAIYEYGRDVGFVLMSWPPQGKDIALRVVRAMREVNPHCKMIYIGENRGGCTADDAFFDNVVDISSSFLNYKELRESYRFWSNDGYYDCQYILR